MAVHQWGSPQQIYIWYWIVCLPEPSKLFSENTTTEKGDRIRTQINL
ncbi:hypothetical protein [Calothrix sp. NIES-2100]